LAKKTILDFHEMRKAGQKITFLTAYDYPTALLEERAGIDMILVGDSLGMTVLGYEGTIPVTMDEMIIHTRAVRRGAPNTFVIGDMPFLSYQTSIHDAVYNAGRFAKEAQVDAIKLEGGARVKEQVRAITDAGILVMGHLGLTPQSMAQLGGFKAQGRSAEAALKVVEDAKALEEAGAFAILLEAVPPVVGKVVTERAGIPILGIGAGPYVDGQLLIVSDLLGIFQAFTPKFVKKYANLAEVMTKAFEEYAADVRGGRFPEPKHNYGMPPEEEERFLKAVG